MHRDRKEDCVITYTHGDTYLHGYSEGKANKDKPDEDVLNYRKNP